MAGVRQAIVSLMGKWTVFLESADNLLRGPMDCRHSYSVEVPGEVLMQGVPAKPERPFCYYKKVDVPVDFAECRILLCFTGAYSNARVFVNGCEVGNHAGGFTCWAVDLTEDVIAGKSFELVVEIIDRRNDVSYGSGYAKHSIAGLLRDVYLRAEPLQRVDDWKIVTHIDDLNEVADVQLSFRLESSAAMELQVLLADPEGTPHSAKPVLVAAGESDVHCGISLSRPFLWTAEQPRLYTLDVKVIVGKRVIQEFRERVGIRKIEIAGERLLVNGKAIKLRGVCRHDMHPLLGRVSTNEYELLDVQLAKEANLNFIRTSHYPPTKNFLRLCDQYGLYVEVETALCFIHTYRMPSDNRLPQSGPEFREQILEQVRAMERNARNHPSVLLWSIGNESRYNENIQESYDYLKATDPSRPVLFSYPGTVPHGQRAYDIASIHYPDAQANGWADNFGGFQSENWKVTGYPTLFDEWAHIACYPRQDLREDPNTRNSWAISIDRMWQAVMAEPGALGGAIWSMIDETFALPEELPGRGDWWGVAEEGPAFPGLSVGYGEWGFLDVWRRKKPEFWHIQKAYSPVRIRSREARVDATNAEVVIPLENRHDHLNLHGFSVRLTCGEKSFQYPLPSIEPHSESVLCLPIHNISQAEAWDLEVFSVTGQMVDKERLFDVAKTVPCRPFVAAHAGASFVWRETATERGLHGFVGSFYFRSDTGMLSAVEIGGKRYRCEGPWLTYRAADAAEGNTVSVYRELATGWRLGHWRCEESRDGVRVCLEGMVGEDHPLRIVMLILENGEIQMSYQIPCWPQLVVREIGLVLALSAEFASKSWLSDGYWSAYPDDHPGRSRGSMLLRASRTTGYREKPVGNWWDDTSNDYLFDINSGYYGYHFTAAARSLHENVRYFELATADGNKRVIVDADADIAVRVEQDQSDRILLRLLKEWAYPNMHWGNISRPVIQHDMCKGSFHIRFDG